MQRENISKRTRFEILKRDRFRCRYCGVSVTFKTLRVDHIKPVARGGSSHPSNLATACHDCNSGKGAVPLSTFRFAPLEGDPIEDLFGVSSPRQRHPALSPISISPISYDARSRMMLQLEAASMISFRKYLHGRGVSASIDLADEAPFDEEDPEEEWLRTKMEEALRREEECAG